MTSTTSFDDYTSYAPTYRHRPDYVPVVIDALLSIANVRSGDLVCDIGAGSAHLTLPLLEHGLQVDAVEPTPAMREIGEARTSGSTGVQWFTGVGEDTGRPTGRYALVTYGSSFDLTDRARALREAARILRPGGSFACAWNQRDLSDPLQAKIEVLIRDRVPGYRYGTRRTDQSAVIDDCGLFEPSVCLSGRTVHRVPTDPWCDAWSSHATLGRQAGARFGEVVESIRDLVRDEAGDVIEVPYVTRMWVARLRVGSG